MIFWLVLKLEISYRVIIFWRILVCFRGFFEDYIFAWWNIWVSIILPLIRFNVNGKPPVWHTPCYLLRTLLSLIIILFFQFCDMKSLVHDYHVQNLWSWVQLVFFFNLKEISGFGSRMFYKFDRRSFGPVQELILHISRHLVLGSLRILFFPFLLALDHQ